MAATIAATTAIARPRRPSRVSTFSPSSACAIAQLLAGARPGTSERLARVPAEASGHGPSFGLDPGNQEEGALCAAQEFEDRAALFPRELLAEPEAALARRQ